MGARGPLPKTPPPRHVAYPPGVPLPPRGMSRPAKTVWDGLIREMSSAGVLRTVDGPALAQLCEDQALLQELRKGLTAMTAELTRKAAQEKRALPGNAVTAIIRTTEGRRMLASMRELSAQIIIERREFGLTPASDSRVEAIGGAGGKAPVMNMELALCARKLSA